MVSSSGAAVRPGPAGGLPAAGPVSSAMTFQCSNDSSSGRSGGGGGWRGRRRTVASMGRGGGGGDIGSAPP